MSLPLHPKDAARVKSIEERLDALEAAHVHHVAEVEAVAVAFQNWANAVTAKLHQIDESFDGVAQDVDTLSDNDDWIYEEFVDWSEKANDAFAHIAKHLGLHFHTEPLREAQEQPSEADAGQDSPDPLPSDSEGSDRPIRIGDLVRVNGEDDDFDTELNGRVGRVEDITDGPHPFEVKVDIRDWTVPFNAIELTLLGLNPGDRVRVRDDAGDGAMNGEEGTLEAIVERTDGSAQFTHQVKHDNYIGPMFYKEEELEVIA